VDWRDRTLNVIAKDYERGGQQAKADRLRHFLQGARAIVSENGRFDTLGRAPRLEAYVSERLPELSHGRPVTTIGPYWRRWRTLTGEFRRIRDDDLLVGRRREASEWHPAIEQAEAGLTRVKKDEGGYVNLASRRLSAAERDEVIATPRGIVREPDVMALRLLWLSCRPPGEALKDFRLQLNRYKPGPVPLTAPDPDAPAPIPLEPAPPDRRVNAP